MVAKAASIISGSGARVRRLVTKKAPSGDASIRPRRGPRQPAEPSQLTEVCVHVHMVMHL